MDLTTQFPRSPKEKIAGIVHVGRMLDKARAYKNNTLGEYIFPCPLDSIILEFLKIDKEEFSNKACTMEENQFESWVAKLSTPYSSEKIAEINDSILNSQPDSKEKWKRFYELRDQLDSNRKDIQKWVDLIDLEEDRI